MLSIITPTYNEKEVIGDLITAVFNVLNQAQIPGELIIVDDNSPDGTADIAEAMNKMHNIKVVRRSGKLGLSSAVIEGFNAATGEILLVMDADLSHDPAIIPLMHNALTDEGYELAVGSRYVPGGGVKDWPVIRQIISRGACLMGSFVTPIKDVTSGYFAFKRAIIEGVKLNPIGYKIGLEIFVKARYRKWKEIPYIFSDRKAGKSKLTQKVMVHYIAHLKDLIKYKYFGK
jgi:dolichol-phosphate mannosyltransferase